MPHSKPINFSSPIERALHNKVLENNKKCPKERHATISMLKAVYRKGAGSYSPKSQQHGLNRNQWAMARVNAFLYLLSNGKPKNAKYTMDNSLLPKGHPRSTRNNDAIVSSAVDDYAEELTVYLKDEEDYASSEEAIFALTEYMGLGYEAEPAIRASWLRAIRYNEDSPYSRAKNLAESTYNSVDADLLPNTEKGSSS